jgi:hypothetical protein
MVTFTSIVVSSFPQFGKVNAEFCCQSEPPTGGFLFERLE